MQKYFKSFKYAIITGASSGIGKAFLDNLFEINNDLIFCNVSRRPINDDKYKFLINGGFDLSEPENIKKLIHLLEEKLIYSQNEKILLINCAGLGDYNEFAKMPKNKVKEILYVNINTPVFLSNALLKHIIKSKGAMINVCSTAAFQPTPLLALYGASKSFVLSWTLAIASELKAYECKVLALCPGPTPTNFFENSEIDLKKLPDKLGVSADVVVKKALKALYKNKVYIIVGKLNKVLIFFSNMIPISIKAKLAFIMMKKFQ